jgi:hypothetical protein
MHNIFLPADALRAPLQSDLECPLSGSWITGHREFGGARFRPPFPSFTNVG